MTIGLAYLLIDAGAYPSEATHMILLYRLAAGL
jgi:hypothetical protein